MSQPLSCTTDPNKVHCHSFPIYSILMNRNPFCHGKLYCINYYLRISVPFAFRRIKTSTTLNNKKMKGCTISLNYHPCLLKTPSPSPSVLETKIRLPQNVWICRFCDKKPILTVNHTEQFFREITHYLSAIV